MHVLADARRNARERVEDGGCVVLATRLGARDPPVVDQEVRVLAMLADVVARPTWILVRVPACDESEHGDQPCRRRDATTQARARDRDSGARQRNDRLPSLPTRVRAHPSPPGRSVRRACLEWL